MLKKTKFRVTVNSVLIYIVCVVFATGCTTFSEKIAKVPKDHILMFDYKGHPVEPCTFATPPIPNHAGSSEKYKPNICEEVPKGVWPEDYRLQDNSDFDRHLGNIFKGMDSYFRRKAEECSQNEKCEKYEKKVLFYVHGGLNSRGGSLERVGELYQAIKDEGYYPIFINWHSGLLSTYGDHLVNIRQGEDSPFIGYLTAPVYLGIDLARSIVRAPIVWGSLLLNDLKSNPSIEKKFFDTTAIEIADNISTPPNPDEDICEETITKGAGKFSVYRGEDCRTDSEKARYALVYAGTLPLTKLPSAPFIDSFGTSSWSNMLRRVQLLYNGDREYHAYSKGNPPQEGNLYDPKPKNYLNIPASGGLSRFMKQFMNSFQNELKQREVKLTLVGHSTGTNVLNELIRNFGVTGQDSPPASSMILPIDNIVYMAAASTVSHFQSTVIPYLLQNDETNFYNLTLGREAEIRDEYFGLTPRGSLLVWIDEFLSTPLTHRDRTLGRFDNFMLTAHEIPPQLRERIHLKTYSTGDPVRKTNPQHHTDFGSIKFWNKDCWTKTSKNCYQKSN